MLSGAHQSKIKGGELGRGIASRAASLIKTGRRLTDRQVAHLICQHLCMNERTTMAHTINDNCILQWMGDSHDKVLRFSLRWGGSLDTMRTPLDSVTLQELLVEQLCKSLGFESEVKALYRGED